MTDEITNDFLKRLGTEVRGKIRRPRYDEEHPIRISESGSARRWAASHDVYWGATSTYDELPPGLFRCSVADGIGPILMRQDIETDDIIELPNSVSTSVLREFETFWDLEDEFAARGFLMKRGFLFWGPAGSGKTVLINTMIKKLIARQKGIVVFIDEPRMASGALRMIRQIEPSRPIIAVIEELDALIEKFGENEYLALLDGEAGVSNILFLATTNWPERLDRRFLDRPARFDTVTYIGMPSAPSRRAYLTSKEPSLKDDELDQWVRMTEGFSIAHLRELIVSVKCFKQPLEDVIRRLEAMHGQIPKAS